MHWIGFGWKDFNPKMEISGAATDPAAPRTWVDRQARWAYYHSVVVGR
jgi:hypothetical protein